MHADTGPIQGLSTSDYNGKIVRLVRYRSKNYMISPCNLTSDRNGNQRGHPTLRYIFHRASNLHASDIFDHASPHSNWCITVLLGAPHLCWNTTRCVEGPFAILMSVDRTPFSDVMDNGTCGELKHMESLTEDDICKPLGRVPGSSFHMAPRLTNATARIILSSGYRHLSGFGVGIVVHTGEGRIRICNDLTKKRKFWEKNVQSISGSINRS